MAKVLSSIPTPVFTSFLPEVIEVQCDPGSTSVDLVVEIDKEEEWRQTYHATEPGGIVRFACLREIIEAWMEGWVSIANVIMRLDGNIGKSFTAIRWDQKPRCRIDTAGFLASNYLNISTERAVTARDRVHVYVCYAPQEDLSTYVDFVGLGPEGKVTTSASYMNALAGTAYGITRATIDIPALIDRAAERAGIDPCDITPVCVSFRTGLRRGLFVFDPDLDEAPEMGFNNPFGLSETWRIPGVLTTETLAEAERGRTADTFALYDSSEEQEFTFETAPMEPAVARSLSCIPSSGRVGFTQPDGTTIAALFTGSELKTSPADLATLKFTLRQRSAIPDSEMTERGGRIFSGSFSNEFA